jgi:hypothetical protein
MQSLGNLNTVSGNSITYSAVANVVVPEGISTYDIRVPTWDVIKTLGNARTGVTITHAFDWGNLPANSQNVTVSESLANVTYSYAANVLTISGIRTAEDYLNTVGQVNITYDDNGVFGHNSNVSVAGNNWLYTINVTIPEEPEFFPLNIGNMVYNFFGGSLSNLSVSNVSTQFTNSQKVKINPVNSPGVYTLTVDTQDSANAVVLNTSGPNLSINSFTTVGGNGRLTLQGNISDLNLHLANIVLEKSSACVANVPSINRNTRTLTWTLTNPGNTVGGGGTRTQSYYSNFAQGFSGNTDIVMNYTTVGNTARACFTANTLPIGIRFTGNTTYQDYTQLGGIDIAYVGAHPTTQNPHFAVAQCGNVGGYQVQLLGLTANTAAVEIGPRHYVSNRSNSFASMASSFDNAWGTQGQLTGNIYLNSVNVNARIGCDAGDLFNYANANPGGSSLLRNDSTGNVQICSVLTGFSQMPNLYRISAGGTFNYWDAGANVRSQLNPIQNWQPNWDATFGPSDFFAGLRIGNSYQGVNGNYPAVIRVSRSVSNPSSSSILFPIKGENGHLVSGQTGNGTPLVAWRGTTTTKASGTGIVGQEIISLQVAGEFNTVVEDINLMPVAADIRPYFPTITGLVSNPLASGGIYGNVFSVENIVKGPLVAVKGQAVVATVNGTWNSAGVQIEDSTGNAYNVTIARDVSTQGNARVSTNTYLYGSKPMSLYLDGSASTYLFVGAAGLELVNQTNYTLELSAYFSDTGVNRVLASAGQVSTANGWQLVRNSSNTLTWFNSAGNSVTVSSTLSANQWYRIAVVKSGTTFSVYVNGTRTYVDTSATTYTASSLSFIRIGWGYSVSGGQYSTATNTHNGYIDEFRISSTARYSGASYTVATAPWTLDGSTLSLIHFIGPNNCNVFWNSQAGTTIKGTGGLPVTNGYLVFEPGTDCPSTLYLRGNARNTGTQFDYGGVISIFDSTSVTSARWSTVIPGAMAIVQARQPTGTPGNLTKYAYLVYTKYTGSPTTTFQSSAGLYYRLITIPRTGALVWGDPVQVQDPNLTGNIYGLTMSAQSTLLNNTVYIMCLISPYLTSAQDDVLKKTAIPVGIRIPL